MDLAIVLNNGLADVNLTGSAEDIFNNIYISVGIERGSWFFNPRFGLRRRERLKNTEKTRRLIEADYREALQWIIDAGRATRIDVTTERDRNQVTGRLKILIEAYQADGSKVTFTTFKEVI